MVLGEEARSARPPEHLDEGLPLPHVEPWESRQGEIDQGGPQAQSLPNKFIRERDEDVRGEHDEYTIPDDYRNLDELAAPSPVNESQQERDNPYLEDRKVGSQGWEDYDNLDELAAPAPIIRRGKDREQSYLEDREEEAARLSNTKSQKVVINDSLENAGASSPSTEESAEKSKPTPQHERVSKLATQIYTISYLIFFSILGTLARLGLQALTFYPGAPVQTGLLWANVGGSLIMGFLSEDRKLFSEEWGTKGHDVEKGKMIGRSPSVIKNHAAVKKTLPLYIGLATGFCGSFTSFSSFMRDSFFALSNALPVPINHPSSAPVSETIGLRRNPGYSFMAVLAVLTITVGLSLSALQLGAHIALAVEPVTPTIPFLFARKFVDRSFVMLAWGCWLGAIFMAIWPPDRPGGPAGSASWAQEKWRGEAVFALVFAPLGCLLRFYVSLHLNGRVRSFPLGTFAINIFGTAMEGLFLDLQRVPIGGMVGCQVLQGMSDGFCGCLTTVSTWVAEVKGLRLRHAYIYGAVSLGVALSLMVIITGSLQWTKGFKSPLCTT